MFDRVFGQEVNQDGVWEYLEESVNAFIQGYNVSLLAYGQSGAGKSYTMGTSGPDEQSNIKVMGEFDLARATDISFIFQSYFYHSSLGKVVPFSMCGCLTIMSQG